MTDSISRILSGAVFAVLALLGMVMALVFMFSTAIAMAVLYIVARLRGKPFGIGRYWHQRSQAYHFGSAPFNSSRAGKPSASEVIDVQVRDVS